MKKEVMNTIFTNNYSIIRILISRIIIIYIIGLHRVCNYNNNNGIVNANKDSNYYPWGANPNNKFRMYWKDSMNVLQDLSQFQSLYIKYHGCV